MQGPFSRGDCADMVLHGQLWQRSNARKDFVWAQGSVPFWALLKLSTLTTVKSQFDPPEGYAFVRAPVSSLPKLSSESSEVAIVADRSQKVAAWVQDARAQLCLCYL